MFKKKKSLFERLSGAREHDDDDFEDVPVQDGSSSRVSTPKEASEPARSEGHLPVDMYQTPSEIVIRSFVAGVRADELNVSISRDMVVIEGSREERSDVTGPDYFSQELFWGSFSRSITLPQEVDVENCTASAKDGLLTITLPKLDRARQTKLRVRAN
jgi:HSP20 family protein